MAAEIVLGAVAVAAIAFAWWALREASHIRAFWAARQAETERAGSYLMSLTLEIQKENERAQEWLRTRHSTAHRDMADFMVRVLDQAHLGIPMRSAIGGESQGGTQQMWPPLTDDQEADLYIQRLEEARKTSGTGGLERGGENGADI